MCILPAGFTEKEVHDMHEAISHSKHFGRPLRMAIFVHLKIGELPLFKLNFGVMTLEPKKANVVWIQQYVHISI